MHPELPYDIDAERATLGSILLNREAIIPVAPWLSSDDFYVEAHRLIYAAALACYQHGTPPDTRTVAAELKRLDQLERVGGVMLLSELIDGVPTSYHVEWYARTVEETARLRRLIDAGSKIAALGFDRARGADEATGDAQALLNAVSRRSAARTLRPIGELVDRYYDKLTLMQSGERAAFGTPTHWRDLDEILGGGLQDDDLVIVAARPAVGKTSFMLSLAYNIARHTGADVPIFSLEMSDEQLFIRLLAMDTRIDTHRLKTFHLSEHETGLAIQAMERLHDARVFIADISAMTATDIRSALLRHLAESSRPIVPMIDYLQLMGSTRQRENRVQDVSEITRALKTLARELHCPVVALSQLSRAVEGRTSHVPLLSDLRESGSIEQDSDIVLMLYREELYQKDTDRRGIAEIHIAKHRNGPVGVVPMRFDASTTRFDTLTYREEERGRRDGLYYAD